MKEMSKIKIDLSLPDLVYSREMNPSLNPLG